MLADRGDLAQKLCDPVLIRMPAEELMEFLVGERRNEGSACYASQERDALVGVREMLDKRMTASRIDPDNVFADSHAE